MTTELQDALRRIARAQIAVAPSLSNTLGSDVAQELVSAYESLLAALDEPEKKSTVFGESMFTPKKAKKKG